MVTTVTGQPNLPLWQIIGESVQGASHERRGIPNQDALRAYVAETGYPVIAAVADGHGSARSFRSRVGSKVAVKRAIDVMKRLLADQGEHPSLSVLNHLAMEQLPKLLHRRWQEAVDEQLKNAPWDEAELENAGLNTPQARSELEQNPRIAFGTTLLMVAVTDTFILYLQLGDGDILIVPEQGAPVRPLAGDARLFANETTSLASPNAWQDFRVQLQVLETPASAPALILLSTDGYANSFQNEESFLKVGPDFLEMVRSDGPAMIKENLAGWLQETSRAGCGDDITVAILCRSDIAPDIAAPQNTARTSPKFNPVKTRRLKLRTKSGPPWGRRRQN